MFIYSLYLIMDIYHTWMVRDPYSMQARNIVAAFCHTQGCRAKEEPATPPRWL